MKHYNFFIFLSFIIFIVGCSENREKNDEINIIFRYDDTSVYTSNEVESKILTIFKEQHLSLSFAVIPYRCEGNPIDTSVQNVIELNTKKVNLLTPYVKDGTLDIVLHGYSHQTTSKDFWTEFENVSYQEQLDKIQKGKVLFEKLFPQDITSFVPPYNTYDINTIKILESLHFNTLSANLDAPILKDSKLNFISNTITINKVDQAIKKAKGKGGVHFIVVMFHEYNFTDIKMDNVEKPEITFNQLKSLLNTLKETKDINILSLNQASKKLNLKNTVSIYNEN